MDLDPLGEWTTDENLRAYIVSVRLTKKEWTELNQIAKTDGTSRSEVIRNAVYEILANRNSKNNV